MCADCDRLDEGVPGKFGELLKILSRWETKGVVRTGNVANAVKIAHVPRDFPQAYLHQYYGTTVG